MSCLDGADSRSYVYDGGDNVQERNSAGSLTKQLVRGTGMGGGIGSVLYTDGAIPSPLTREYFVYNEIGSTIGTVTGTGATVGSANIYGAWGDISHSTGSSDNKRLFCTKERSAELGLDNFGHRYYDSELGRFVTRDPSGYPDGPNNYLYCNNNPINFIDPLGLGEADKRRNLAGRAADAVLYGLAGGNAGATLRTAQSMVGMVQSSIERKALDAGNPAMRLQ